MSTTSHARARRSARGFSLVELMVAMAIGLIVSLAIFTVLSVSEGRKRTSTSVNDTNLSAAYSAHLLDRALRSAGSGYTQRWDEVVGCRLNVVRDGVTTVLPRDAGTPFPVPFDDVPGTLRLVPALIVSSDPPGGSDVLAVMSGSSGFAELPVQMQPLSATATSVRLPMTLGIRGDDLMLLAHESGNCLMQQVENGFQGGAPQEVRFAGQYYTASGQDMNLVDVGGGESFAVHLGNWPAVATAPRNPPHFQLFGVGENNTLMSYDLLRLDGTDVPVPIADGVVLMRAIYGLDTDGDQVLDTWQDPSEVPFDAATLLDGSAASRVNLRQIMAIRIGLLLRTTAQEREELVSPPSYTLFGNLEEAVSGNVEVLHELTEDEQRFRYRVLEATVPLRNMLMLQP